MKHTLLTLTMAAQLAVGTAYAQTTETMSEANAPDLQPVAYGADWPQTLVLALFEQDGLTVRPADEIATQWVTLADQDQDLIRRDCEDVMQITDAEVTRDTSGAATGTDATGTPLGDGTTGDQTGAQAGTQSGSETADAVTGTEVPGTTGATGETGTTGSTSVTPFTGDAVQGDDEAATGDGIMMSEDSITAPISVSIAQMEEICAATEDL